MEFVVNTIWKHPKKINWKKMQSFLDEALKEAPKDISVRWYEIDENHHGAILIFPDKASYEKKPFTRKKHRNENKERDVELIYEFVGHVKTEGST